MSRLYFIICFVLTVFIASCQSDSRGDAIELNPEVFKDSLSKAGVQVVDVRTLKEFQSGHIKNALHIDYSSEKFANNLGVLDTEKPVYIYCRSGRRSSKSVSIFKGLGFKDVYELEGGVINWRKEGFNITKK